MRPRRRRPDQMPLRHDSQRRPSLRHSPEDVAAKLAKAILGERGYRGKEFSELLLWLSFAGQGQRTEATLARLREEHSGNPSLQFPSRTQPFDGGGKDTGAPMYPEADPLVVEKDS